MHGRFVPRSAGEKLRRAVMALAGDQAELIAHAERAWASITFAGSRHTLELVFTGAPAVEAGERFVALLPDHEFAIAGRLVASADVVAVDHVLLPAPRMTVTCEILLLEDA
ncbi:hypothetical protein [Qipengyuania sp. JC766]|uniref:hypothetical protein n=1 Tax=Qipengyuania sp. JC766 TaxID=3232139 RepID=UPI0034581F73